ncbi:MAG TPA: sulfur carrier protein ThiS [Chloroflexota bacterium]|nr:sulfur carrier protein ThiS [Chloroflexota bacterium]
MNITVNGKARRLEGNPSVGDYLRRLGINPLAVAVERNGQIVKRDQFEATPIAEGDRLEIVRMMGGG